MIQASRHLSRRNIICTALTRIIASLHDIRFLKITNWRKKMTESSPRRDSLITLHIILFTTSRVSRFGISDVLLFWWTVDALVLSILVKFDSLRYLLFVKKIEHVHVRRVQRLRYVLSCISVVCFVLRQVAVRLACDVITSPSRIYSYHTPRHLVQLQRHLFHDLQQKVGTSSVNSDKKLHYISRVSWLSLYIKYTNWENEVRSARRKLLNWIRF